MVPYVDAALLGYLATVYNNDPSGDNPTVCWGPPEATRQSMAIGQENQYSGVPGMSVFRVGTMPDPERQNMNRTAGVGLPSGFISQSGVNVAQQRILSFPVLAEYDVVAWANSQSDMDDIEREMWFMTKYKALTASIPTTNPDVSANFRWYMKVGNPTYAQEINTNQGEIVWYRLMQKVTVATDWVHTKDINTVLQINAEFYERMISGDVITNTLLDQFTIIPTAA